MATSAKKSVDKSVMESEAAMLSALFENVKSRAAFAKKFGINPTMIQQHLKAIRPISLDYAKVYAKAFNRQLSDISPRLSTTVEKASVYIESMNQYLDSEYTAVNMMDLKLSAGVGNIVTSHDVKNQISFQTEFLRKMGVKPNRAIAFPVDGDSMIDVHIKDESVVALNLDKRTPVNKMFFAIWHRDKYMIKQLIKNGDHWIARSHNKDRAHHYPDIPIDDEDSGIVGQAFWCGFCL